MADEGHLQSPVARSENKEQIDQESDSYPIHETNLFSDVDRGWAFVVLCAAFGSMFCTANLVYATGVLHVALLEKFQMDTALTSLTGSVFMSLLSLTGPAVSFVVNTWSCRVGVILGGLLVFTGFTLSFFVKKLSLLLLTYSIVAGCGMGFLCLAPIIAIGYAFEKYRGMAVGFTVMGAGFGMFTSGPLAQFLLDTFGLHGTFLLLGGIGLQCVFLGSLMRPSQLERTQKINLRRAKISNNGDGTQNRRCQINCGLFRNKTFILIAISGFLWNAAYSIISVNLSNYAYLLGTPKQEAALLWTMVGIGSTVNRFLAGLTLGPNGIDPLLLDFGFLGILGVLTITFPMYAAFFSGQCLFALLYGIYSGGLVVLTNPLCLELVGLQELPLAVGYIYFFAGIGSIIGPPVTGLLVDVTNDYSFAFYQSGGLFFMSAMLALMSSLWRSNIEFSTAASIVSLNSARFLSGSAFLSGSVSLIIDPFNRADRDSIHSYQSGNQRSVNISSENVARILLEKKLHGRERTLSENDAQFSHKNRNSPIMFDKRTLSVHLGDKSQENTSLKLHNGNLA